MTGPLGALIGLTLADPNRAAREIMALGLPDSARWLGLALVSVLAVLVMNLTMMVAPEADPHPMIVALRHPLTGVVVQAGSILLLAAAVAFVGGLFGGRGGFADALTLMLWLEFLMVLAGALQIAVVLTVPALAFLVSALVIFEFVWILVHFVVTLHGFTRRFMVLLGMIASFVVLALLLGLVLTVLGIAPPEAA
jgi:hypothetical protein